MGKLKTMANALFGNSNANAAAGQSTAGSAGAAVGQQSVAGSTFSFPGPGALGSSGNITIQTGTGNMVWTSTGVSTLTAEEADELKTLHEQYVIEVKAARLAEFKKLPAELRQFVMNSITWGEEAARLEAVSPGKTQRQVELETKQGNTVNLSGTWGVNTIYVPHMAAEVKIPEGMSIEDLKQAHTEQTLEEQMIDND